MSCLPFIVTSQASVKIIERCGAFHGIARPGLSFVVPCCDCVSGSVSMRLQQMEVSCETKTKDNVFVSIKVAVQFQVKQDDDSINAAHYRLTNARQQASAAKPGAGVDSSHSWRSADRIVRLRCRALLGTQD